MGQCEKTKNQAEQNKSHAVAGIEAHPTPPHCCFFRNDRCNLAHADLQCGVTGRELWPPERIDEVDNSERKDNARTKNHENFCGQDALPILWAHCRSLSALQRFLYLLVMLHILDSMPHHSFDEIQSPARAQGLCVHRFDGWLAINRNSRQPPNRLVTGQLVGKQEVEGALANEPMLLAPTRGKGFMR